MQPSSFAIRFRSRFRRTSGSESGLSGLTSGPSSARNSGIVHKGQRAGGVMTWRFVPGVASLSSPRRLPVRLRLQASEAVTPPFAHASLNTGIVSEMELEPYKGKWGNLGLGLMDDPTYS